MNHLPSAFGQRHGTKGARPQRSCGGIVVGGRERLAQRRCEAHCEGVSHAHIVERRERPLDGDRCESHFSSPNSCQTLTDMSGSSLSTSPRAACKRMSSETLVQRHHLTIQSSYNTKFVPTIIEAYKAEGFRVFWRGKELLFICRMTLSDMGNQAFYHHSLALQQSVPYHSPSIRKPSTNMLVTLHASLENHRSTLPTPLDATRHSRQCSASALLVLRLGRSPLSSHVGHISRDGRFHID